MQTCPPWRSSAASIASAPTATATRQGGYSQAYLFDDGDVARARRHRLRARTRTEILKYLWSIGRSPNELTDIAITHAHRSHLGGLATLKRLAPQATVHSHEFEADIIGGGRASQPIPLKPLLPLKLYPLRILQLLGLPKHVPLPGRQLRRARAT